MDAAVLTISCPLIDTSSVLTMDFFPFDLVTIEKGEANTLLVRLTELGVLPYCGPIRSTGSAFSTVTVSTVRDLLEDSEKLEECKHFTSLSEYHASETRRKG